MKQCYICEVCNEHYDSAVAASDCEKSHWHIDKEKIDEIYAYGLNEDYDSVGCVVIPIVRTYNGQEEHSKMRFILDGYCRD